MLRNGCFTGAPVDRPARPLALCAPGRYLAAAATAGGGEVGRPRNELRNSLGRDDAACTVSTVTTMHVCGVADRTIRFGDDVIGTAGSSTKSSGVV